MDKTLLVLRYEVGAVLRSRSFLITALGLPLLGVLIFLGFSLFRGDTADVSSGAGDAGRSSDLQVEGYVDRSGLIQVIPSDLPEGILVAYPDEASARQALRAGEITAYYVIPADYVARGELTYVNPGYSWVTSGGQSWIMEQTLFANLLGNDATLMARAQVPMDLHVTSLSPAEVERNDDSPLAFYVPYGAMMIFYLVTMMSASLLLNSVSNEKKNRLMEVLLLSVHPRQLFTGKIVGLGLIGMLEAAVWFGVGYTLLKVSEQRGPLPPGIDLPPAILGWGFVFFVLGYALYASLMAGLGALAPSLKEASQVVIMVIWPLLIPMLLIAPLIDQPRGPLAVGLSLFPPTAPVTMIIRLAASEVPLWQLLLATVLLLTTAVVVVRAVARAFHAQTLLSGQPISVRRFLRALF